MNDPELSNQLRLNHILRSITFGDSHEHMEIRRRFGLNDHTKFDMMQLVDDALYEKPESMDYFYFFKLVPHVFIDEINQRDYRSYSYSLNHNSKVKHPIWYTFFV